MSVTWEDQGYDSGHPSCGWTGTGCDQVRLPAADKVLLVGHVGISLQSSMVSFTLNKKQSCIFQKLRVFSLKAISYHLGMASVHGLCLLSPSPTYAYKMNMFPAE